VPVFPNCANFRDQARGTVDIDAFAAALAATIAMTTEEQVTRMQAMRKVVAGRNVFNGASDTWTVSKTCKPSPYSIRSEARTRRRSEFEP
jgi:hypothetical protein